MPVQIGLPGASSPTDVVDVHVALGSRVVVVGGLRLAKDATTASTWASQQVARALEWTGPGVVIFAGDLVDLLASDLNSPSRALSAHGRLAVAVQAFVAVPDRRVICLAGMRDGRLARDAALARTLGRLLGSEVAVAAELTVETGSGARRVRVEGGYRPDGPGPDVLPTLPEAAWLDGIGSLGEPGRLRPFVASRVTYRGIVPSILIAVLGVVAAITASRVVPAWSAGCLLAALEIAAGIAWARARRGWAAAVAELPDDPRAAADEGHDQSAVPADHDRDRERDRDRDVAVRLVAHAGHVGAVTGQSIDAQLTSVGDGFFASVGSGSEVIGRWPGRLGLPAVFLPHRQASWLEMEAGAALRVRLHQARLDLPGGTLLERLAARKPVLRDAHARVVGGWPDGPSFPERAAHDPFTDARRIRRWASAVIAVAGLVDLASAVTPPLVDRLRLLLEGLPLAVPQTAAALAAVSGIGLLALARGVRRGQRRAWAIALVLLIGSVVLNLVKGFDLEEAAVAGLAAAFLAHHRHHFRTATEPASLRRGLGAVVVGATLAVGVGTAATELSGGVRPPFTYAVEAVAERLVGLMSLGLPDRPVDDFLTPCLMAIGLSLMLFAGWTLFRPVVQRRGATELDRAREVVRRHGRDTMAYFALRDDKRHFFSGESVVAYAVWGGVCLVSPDPIGPESSRAKVWEDFHRFCDEHGWMVAVLGASEEWLPIYHGASMQSLYVGDEAVVRCQGFSLEGGRYKGLRQAVNRVVKYGYRVEFHDPATLTPALRQALLQVMRKSRRGDVERGFSMTLGRVFDAADTGLLLAVCYAPSGEPVAFCQYLPAPGIDGYSLDLMRRDQGDHPNGIVDFLVVQTIRHLADQGMSGLGLNFATFRAVVAGDAGHGLGQQAQRWFLRQMSDSMQIESLWRFTAKYDPDWQPRYAVHDGVEHVLAAALAVARAESFWELPVIGRFLVRSPGPLDEKLVDTTT